MLTKSLILQKLKEFKPLFKKEDVKILGLFGSYARGTEKSSSDIDVLIETMPPFLQKNIGWDAFVKLDELRNILQKSFQTKVDIVDKQGLLDHNNTYILEKTIYV